eukprot:g33259.t1
MVSSRIMCVECAGCETEPFVEIDPWADESDVDTNQALKRAIDNVVKVNNSRTPPLPVVDIRNRWHQVTFDGCVALACTVPVFSIFAGRYIIKHYLLERWSLIFPDHHDFSRRLRTWLTSEALIWLLLVDVVLADRSQSGPTRRTHLQPIPSPKRRRICSHAMEFRWEEPTARLTRTSCRYL